MRRGAEDVRVERPDPAAGRDRSGQVDDAWLAVAECWAAVGPVPQAAPLPERAGAVVGVSGRRVTVYRDAVPGLEEAGTRWRVVLLVLDDPDDPTPYWMVSTRHPDRVLAALR